MFLWKNNQNIPELLLNTNYPSQYALQNSVDPDEMALNKLSHQHLHCLSFCFIFLADFSICKNTKMEGSALEIWG